MSTPNDSNSAEFPDAAGYPDGAGYLDEGTADPAEDDAPAEATGIIGEDPDFAVPPPAETDDDGSAPD
ncbi:hypothetical protein [Cryobacterium arcticum]|uniref:Uncharacterized protein n=1 Tax=Cryobacterium arcticum TaxID=670052 RepID=A0A317ZQ53_9MICO|nr:hypothetical protein [Cryobacterium arcticum]PXA67183.1 hypothetical protein CTB96_10500 [Cryobacterium arcticum]